MSVVFGIIFMFAQGATLFGIIFMFAQGATIFGSAWLMAFLTGKFGWLAKIVWMIASYLAWVVFTFFLFGWMGADVFILPMGGAISAIIPSILFGAVWLSAPTLRRHSNG